MEKLRGISRRLIPIMFDPAIALKSIFLIGGDLVAVLQLLLTKVYQKKVESYF